MKKIVVCGAGGFIGGHLVTNLRNQGHYVIGADIKLPEFNTSDAHEFKLVDLRDPLAVSRLLTSDINEIYQLAADMGGAGYVFTGENDADIMHNSVLININILNEMVKKRINRIFYSSSACMYPSHNQVDPLNPNLAEDTAYPANPDSEYGWEKLFSERLYLSYARNYGLTICIARFHNVFGPLGTWQGGREKSPAALCRKVATSTGEVEIWGNGTQTRSFLYITDCIDGINRLMASGYTHPVNLGSSHMISINDMALLIATIADKPIRLKHIAGPTGVAGRTSDNRLIQEVLNWSPPDNLEHGLRETYNWINQQL